MEYTQILKANRVVNKGSALTPTSEIKLEHVFVDMRVQHSTNQSTVHYQGFTDHPRHLTQPEVVHQECNLNTR